MTTTSTARGARDILMMFATEGEPTPRRLEAYAKDHPELRRELTELAVEMVLEPSRALPPADASTKRTVASAWARFQAGTRSEAERASARSAATLPSVFAGFSGAAFPRLAARLDVTPLFLIKVKDGLIEAAGFPQALLKLISDEVGHEVEVIRANLGRPSAIPRGMMAKSDGKPVAGAKQTFEEAVATSGLTAEQQKRLLDMAEAERGSD
ncbi:hypothetical protein PUR21_23145 [Methylorubrum rhodesianum]|uniref:Terminase small subunit n=1 Tax=Methylorubrum rhodesianum TaxID=29427 RepID=A0ABU9ZHT8_9HYPH